jgi:hypothetical protein
MVHAILPLFQQELVTKWIPFTWFLGRFVLGVCVLIGSVFAHSKVVAPIGVIVSVLLSIVSTLILAFSVESIPQVYREGIIARPFDAIMIILWLVVLLSCWQIPLARVQTPVGFRLFLSLGVIVHIIMAFFSRVSLDFGFMLAHYIKIAEYAVWLIGTKMDEARARKNHLIGKAEYIYHASEDLKKLEEVCQTLKSLSQK